MSKNTRSRIQDEAFHMFAECGYRNTTLRTLAARCGMTHANIIYHFKNKRELGVSYMQSYVAALHSSTLSLAAEMQIPPSVQQYAIYLSLHLHMLTAFPGFADSFCEILADERDILPGLALQKASDDCGKNAIMNLLTEQTALCSEPELSVNMYMLTEADYRLVNLLRSGQITREQALRYYLRAACLLLLHEAVLDADIDAAIQTIRQIDLTQACKQIQEILFVEKC